MRKRAVEAALLSVVAALVALGATAAGPGCTVAPTKTGWVLRNPRMRVSVSAATGEITSLAAGREMLAAPAGVVLADALLDRTLPGDAAPTGARVSARDGSAALSFEKAYGGSHRARVTLTLSDDALRWDVQAATDLSPDREAQIEFRLPLLAGMTQAFWAAGGAPCALASVPRQVTYRRDTALPALTLFNEGTDRGVTLVAPFEVPKPGMAFRFEPDASRRQLRVACSLLRMGREKPAMASLFLVPHAGDWRPGLAWMLRAYPDYFRPVSQRVRNGEGWYSLAWPGSGEDVMKDLAGRRVTWQEFHGYYPFMGHYAPDRQEWAMVMDQDTTGLEQWEAGNPPGFTTNSLRNMREKIDLWHRHGVQAYIYYQTFEAWRQHAAKYFPGDVARDAAGAPHEAWCYCNLMNPDPASKWGSYILGQLDRLLAAYPDVDGIFLDRADYCGLDFAHDDGLSMQRDRPCYMLGFAQERALARIAPTLHARGKGIWTNGPTSIEVARGVDGIMAEMVGPAAEMFQYLGLERPLICLPYDADATATEVKLKTCLAGGYFPAATTLGPGTESRAIEARYAPLLALTKGRRWVLNAHALTLPAGIRGDLFRAPNGDYLVPLVSPDASQVAAAAATTPFSLDLPVRVRVPDAARIRRCTLLSGDYAGGGELPFTRKGEEISLRVPAHVAASLVVLSARQEQGAVRLSPPLLIRGETNRLAVRLPDGGARALELQSPWGSVPGKMASAQTLFPVAVPSGAPKGPASLRLTGGKQTLELGAWVVDPVEIRRLGGLFLTQAEGEDAGFTVTNCTGRRQSVTLSGSFVEGGGDAVPAPARLTLAAHQARPVRVRLAPRVERSRLELRAALNGRSVAAQFPVATVAPFAPDDLFHDDFASGGMGHWRLSGGDWLVKEGAAAAWGASHLALAGEPSWADYSFEVVTKMLGSRDPAVNWLKSYLFFRVQDPGSFYRFGFHGGTEVIDLWKLAGGQWICLASVPGSARKDTWYSLKVEARGPDLTCYVDGQQVLHVKDGTYPNGGVGIGVLEDGMANAYRHAVVKRLR